MTIILPATKSTRPALNRRVIDPCNGSALRCCNEASNSVLRAIVDIVAVYPLAVLHDIISVGAISICVHDEIVGQDSDCWEELVDFEDSLEGGVIIDLRGGCGVSALASLLASTEHDTGVVNGKRDRGD